MLTSFLRLWNPAGPNLPQPTTPAHQTSSTKTQPSVGCHRERLLSMHLEHTRMCSNTRLSMMRSCGLLTCGDLMTCDLKSIEKQDPTGRTLRVVRRYRSAVRFACDIDGLMPRDALLLMNIHRRSLHTLAQETPNQLHRDIVRFSLSTKGQKIFAGRRVPSVRRVKGWIQACRTKLGENLHVTAQAA